ncbi:MAG: hypothetical protein IPM92_09440 [Saprospiraceae bacterium]|nr:hypothetical protein [Saprospiraceae bacterium]
MSPKTKFSITTIWILFSRFYDAYCTYKYTPNLSKEANPLVTMLGMSWTPLIITIGLLTVYTIYVYSIRVFKPIDLFPSEKEYSFGYFLGYTYLGHKEPWTSIFYKFPKDIHRFNQWMGLTLPQCVAFAGIVSTAMWLLINYTQAYKEMHSATLVYSILIVGCIVINYHYSKKMYRTYLNSTNVISKDPHC